MSTLTTKMSVIKYFVFFLAMPIISLPEYASAASLSQMPSSKSDIKGKSNQELNDLNTPVNNLNKVESIAEAKSSFTHRDEDQEQPRATFNLSAEPNLKYDVEILESNDNRKQKVELEEQFKGPALQMNTDIFKTENIETSDDIKAIKKSNKSFTILLIIAAAVCICIYIGLVSWRLYLERRYSMRELLVNDDYNDMHDDHNECMYDTSRECGLSR